MNAGRKKTLLLLAVGACLLPALGLTVLHLVRLGTQPKTVISRSSRSSARSNVFSPCPEYSRNPAVAPTVSVTQATLDPILNSAPFSNPLTHAVGRAVKCMPCL